MHLQMLSKFSFRLINLVTIWTEKLCKSSALHDSIGLWYNIYLKHEKNIRNMRSLWGVCESFWLVVLWWIFEFFKIFWQTFLYENFLIRIIWQTFYILRNNIFVETIFKWWSYSYVNWIMILRLTWYELKMLERIVFLKDGGIDGYS